MERSKSELISQQIQQKASNMARNLYTPGFSTQEDLRLDHPDPSQNLDKLLDPDSRLNQIRAQFVNIAANHQHLQDIDFDPIQEREAYRTRKIKEDSVILDSIFPKKETPKGEPFDYNHEFILDEFPEVSIDFAQRVKESPQVQQFLGSGASSDERMLIDRFFDSSAGRVILRAILDFVPQSDEDKVKFRDRLAGAAFEQCGYIALESKYGGLGIHVLSPYEMYTYMRNIEPNATPMNHDYNLNLGIRGISIPDGIVIRESKDELIVDSALEYKSSNKVAGRHQKNIERQNKQYGNIGENLRLIEPRALRADYLGSLIHRIRPEISDKPLNIHPSGQIDVIYGLPAKSTIQIPNALHEPIPLGADRLREIVGMLLDSTSEAVKQMEEETKALLHQVDPLMSMHANELFQQFTQSRAYLSGIRSPWFRRARNNMSGVTKGVITDLKQKGYISGNPEQDFSSAENLAMHYIAVISARNVQRPEIPRRYREVVFAEIVKIFDKKIKDSQKVDRE